MNVIKLNRKGVNASVCVPLDKEVGMRLVMKNIFGSEDGGIETEDEGYSTASCALVHFIPCWKM